MTVSFVGYAFVPRAGLAMSAMSRARDRINLYPAAPIRLATMLREPQLLSMGHKARVVQSHDRHAGQVVHFWVVGQFEFVAHTKSR